MNPSSLFSPPILFFSILIMIQLSSAQNLITSTCTTSSQNNPNIHSDFCKTSLQAAPGSQCATLQELGAISIRLIGNNVTDARCHVKQLLEDEGLDSYVRQCLRDCLELFSDAIPTVEQALKRYNHERYDDANIQISSVMTASTTCEDGFTEQGLASPLSKRDEDIFQLSAIALAVMRMVQRGSGFMVY